MRVACGISVGFVISSSPALRHREKLHHGF
jgi:hypothetical protein